MPDSRTAGRQFTYNINAFLRHGNGRATPVPPYALVKPYPTEILGVQTTSRRRRSDAMPLLSQVLLHFRRAML